MAHPGYQPRRRGRRPIQAVTLDRVPRDRCVCGKVPYQSKGEAQGVRRAMQRSRLQGANALVIYQCERRPGAWHLGHGTGE
jgi:hypothetical protein